jgi:hypothetical protein
MMPAPAEIKDTAARLRAALAEPYPGECAAVALAAAGASDASTTAAIAERLGWSPRLLAASLDKLCEPFANVEDLRAIACKLPSRREVVGFVMPGNIPGAGLHELVLTLLTGSAALVKTATAEPLFFAHWAARLATLDPRLGARVAVFNWSRERGDLTLAMRQGCDRLIALGDDTTVADLSANDTSRDDRGRRGDFTGFGARVSGVVLTAGACAAFANDTTARDVACDVSLFEQRGCLSPHHVFAGDPTSDVSRSFAARLAASLRALRAGPLPSPSRLAIEDAAAIRSVREQARWRALGGRDVTLREGPLPGWTVIHDRDAAFSVSPGFRTVFVSPFAHPADLACRLEPVTGRVEAFAFKADSALDAPDDVARIRAVLERAGATYICAPGRMQSPPVDWPHGGGVFLRALAGGR